MKLTRANAIMLQDKPFVTDSTYREYSGTLTAESNSITLSSEYRIDQESILIILNGVVQLDYTITNNKIVFPSTFTENIEYKIMIGVMLKNVDYTYDSLSNVIGIYRFAMGGGAGTWHHLNYDGAIVARDSAYFANHPIYGNITEVQIDGQYMIKIPKFYVKNDNHVAIYISPIKLDGFHCHPAFMKAGVEQDCFYIGKYEGSLTDAKLCSLPSVMPAVNNTITSLLTYASNRNVNGFTGFDVMNIYQISAVQTLILIELKSTDVVSLIGSGNNCGEIAAAGSLKTTNDASVITANYRGIIGLWGNAWELINGAKTDSTGQLIIFDNQGYKNYLPTGFITVNPATISSFPYIVDMSVLTGINFDFKDLFIPKTVSTTRTSGSYSSCFVNSCLGFECVLCFGGGYSQITANIGLFDLSCYSKLSNAAAPTIAGRLTKI
jgi:hypothetical protein